MGQVNGYGATHYKKNHQQRPLRWSRWSLSGSREPAWDAETLSWRLAPGAPGKAPQLLPIEI